MGVCEREKLDWEENALGDKDPSTPACNLNIRLRINF
jgi:hypothetical protein